MYIVFLRFAENKAKAPDFMEGHKAWIAKGLQDGVFLLVGSLQPNAGGMILAESASLADLQARVQDDPFVKENIVEADILEVTPNKADPRLEFLVKTEKRISA